AHLVERAQVLDDAEAAARLADRSFDPALDVVLSPGTSAEALSGTAGGTPATFDEDRPELVRIAVRALADSYLVLSDAWYPGWVATVDDAEVPIERANILFRAVRVPP